MKKNPYRIIGVDFDGTLAVTKGTYPEIQRPIPEVIEYIKEEQNQGAFLVLITMREGEELRQAEKWCLEQGIEVDHMKRFFKNNPRKIFCNEYIDDTNIGGIEHILEEIKKERN